MANPEMASCLTFENKSERRIETGSGASRDPPARRAAGKETSPRWPAATGSGRRRPPTRSTSATTASCTSDGGKRRPRASNAVQNYPTCKTCSMATPLSSARVCRASASARRGRVAPSHLRRAPSGSLWPRKSRACRRRCRKPKNSWRKKKRRRFALLNTEHADKRTRVLMDRSAP